MKTFIQLKDNIGWSHIDTNGEVPGVEVELGTGENYINKKYENGSWSDASQILFAIINEFNQIAEIRKTYFISEVGNNPVIDDEVVADWLYIDGQWVNPNDNDGGI